MRSFIAIELPETVQSSLSALQKSLMECGADIRWIKPENIHLTLKFLGFVDDKDIRDIVKQIEGTCADYPPFDLVISGIGVFPHIKSPRVFWAGIEEKSTLLELQMEIDRNMATLGFKPEKRAFAPHLTLGRFRSFKGRAVLADTIKSHTHERFGTVHVKALSFMKSELTSAGALYTRIAEVALGQKDETE